MSLYLSRLIVNLRNREVQRDLMDCRRLHRRVMDGYPMGLANAGVTTPRRSLGVLFRVESSPHVQLLVQSVTPPNWERLPDGYLELDWFAGEPSAIISLAPMVEQVSSGSIFRFRLRANPTRRIATKSENGTRRHGRRIELVREEDQLAWLGRKAASGGFEIMSAQTSAPVRSIGSGHDGQHVTIASVLFDGVLRVTDAAAFRETLAVGIGTGKAFGCGLLSIARN